MFATRSVQSQTRTGRLESLTDATFAIVITLLVLEIHRPAGRPGQLAAALAHEWPSYLAYLLAFVYVGVIWLNHHYVFAHLERTDLSLQWINLGILATATLIPFPTGVLSAALAEPNRADQRTAVTLYAAVAFLAVAAWIPLFAYLRRHPSMLSSTARPDHFAADLVRPFVGMLGYVAAVALGLLVEPLAAMAVFVLIVAYYAITSTGTRAARDTGADSGTDTDELSRCRVTE